MSRWAHRLLVLNAAVGFFIVAFVFGQLPLLRKITDFLAIYAIAAAVWMLLHPERRAIIEQLRRLAKRLQPR